MYSSQGKSLLNEEDLRTFLVEPKTSSSPAKKVLIGTICVALSIVFGFYLLNLNAYFRIRETAAAKPVNTQPTPNLSLAVPNQTPTPTPNPVPGPSLPENTLLFADLNISAPVNWDTVFEEKEIQKKLATGVVHLEGTARPGEQGAVVITGHSSNYPWAKGSYNTVFAPLQNAAPGQEVYLRYGDITYGYQVTKTFEVKPGQIEVLNTNSSGTLRLITCTPVGTSLRRLVIEAQQITPSPDKNRPFTARTFSGDLPAVQ